MSIYCRGGLINFVYKCSIKDKTLKPLGKEPTSILLKYAKILGLTKKRST